MSIKTPHIIYIFLLLASTNSLLAVCYADFQYAETSPLEVQFQNTSTSHNEGNVHYYWDFGDGNNSYESDPLHFYEDPGIYTVSLTIITTNLCYSQQAKEIYIGIPPNSPYCSLQIEFETSNATNPPNYNNGIARVYGFSDVPCCYYAFWSNGAEGEYAYNLSPGTYCVTITNGSDCYGTSCVTIGYNNNCIASYLIDSLTYNHLDGAYRFINNSHGEANYYHWDFGDGSSSNTYNPIHVYADTGHYEVCLSIYTYYDCVSTICKDLYVNYISPLTANLYGIVYAGGTLLPQGVAVLYEYSDEEYEAIDFQIFTDGIYEFDSLPKERLYLTHVIPNFDIDTVYFPKYFPTYFSNTPTWQESDFINLFSDTIYCTHLDSYNNIYFDDGAISGNVKYVFESSYEDEIFAREWFEDFGPNEGAASNMVVLLRNSFKEILEFRLTNNDGSFNFSNLEYGIYYLTVEKPGLVSDEILVQISEDLPHYINTNFLILENTITAIAQDVKSFETQIYPNPANESIFIKTDRLTTNIKITNIAGVCVFNNNCSDFITEINISKLSPGLYFVELSDELISEKHKIVVE